MPLLTAFTNSDVQIKFQHCCIWNKLSIKPSLVDHNEGLSKGRRLSVLRRDVSGGSWVTAAPHSWCYLGNLSGEKTKATDAFSPLLLRESSRFKSEASPAIPWKDGKQGPCPVRWTRKKYCELKHLQFLSCSIDYSLWERNEEQTPC